MQARPPRYKLDLSALHAQCEANYARLLQLLPDLDSADTREFQLGSRADQPGTSVVIEVTQRCPYTTMVSVSQRDALTAWVDPPSFEVRLYHDAAMAEVVEYSGLKRPRARYDYPNEEMHQRDEKHQLNRFLGEWLSHCIEHGHSAERVEVCEI